MHPRLRVAAVLVLIPALLTACSSGKPKQSAPSTSSSPTTAAGLSAVNSALATLTSAHLDIDSSLLTGTSTADVALNHGTATAVDLHTTHSGRPVEVVTRTGKSWLKTADGWALISPTSSNATAKALSSPLGVVTLTSSLASVGAVGDLLAAAKVEKTSPEKLGGVQTTRYTLALDPSKLGQSTTLGQLLGLIGGTSIPVDVWINSQNQPVQLTLSASALGEQLALDVRLSKFNAPLNIPTPS